MKYLFKLIVIAFLIIQMPVWLYGQGNFSTSIHKTRKGKNYFYGANTAVTGAPAPGFETLTNVPIDDANLACTSCHPADNLDANGDPYPVPYPGMNCNDCHSSTFAVTEDDCYGCHGRQTTEKNTLGYSDVHRDAANPLVCWDCHKKEELHGDDGVEYNSMLEPGAIKADCQQSGCHESLPAGHSGNDPHGGALHCDACHAQTVIACYNCHFESQVQAKLKRAKQPIHDFVMLANRDKDGKVGTMTFQSLSYQGNTWAAFAPYHAHTITNVGRACTDCHVNFGGQNEAIQQYNSTGQIKFAIWNSGDSTLSWLHGVVPMPADYQSSFKMDFITYNGNPSDPIAPSKNWSAIGEDTWDGHQMFFATPLTKVQMAKIGFDTTITVGIEPVSTDEVPNRFTLQQNYPNPFNPTTTIKFEITEATNVTLTVYDILGAVVETLISGKKMTPGVYEVPFSARDLVSGVYLYRLTASDFTAAKKMVVMK